MAMKPTPTWSKTYKSKLEDAYKKAESTGVDEAAKVWGEWCNENGTGIEVFPPFKSQGTPMEGDFPPPPFVPGGVAPLAAIALANSWMAWYSSIKFSPAPPAPPFSAIISVAPSPTGIVIAYSALVLGLTAQMTIIPPLAEGALELKGVEFGILFLTACITAGVQISGLGIGVPPPPLILPLIPVL